MTIAYEKGVPPDRDAFSYTLTRPRTDDVSLD